MPQVDMPWVRKGQLVTADGQRIWLDTAAWFAWLQTVASFCYSSQEASYWRMTVRCEKRRRQTYWYGYARNDRKLHNIYLGKTERLTQARLEEGCRRLAQRTRAWREASMKEE